MTKMFGQDDNLNDRRSQMHAALCMGFVFIFVGIPIWWKTTEVYRAELPYSAIQELAESIPLETEINITLIFGEQNAWSAEIYGALTQSNHSESTSLSVRYSYRSEAVPDSQIQSILGNPSVLGENLNQENGIFIVFADSEDFDRPRITLTSGRGVLFAAKEDFFRNNPEKVSSLIVQLVTDSIVDTLSLNDVISKAYGTKLDFPKEREAHIMKTIQSNKGYDIVFSLLCSEPDKLRVNWDIQNAVHFYLRPLITKLSSWAEFNTGSQILYYSGLSVKPKLNKNDTNGKSYYLTHKQLSHVINPIESRLGAQISPNPTLNFVIYVTQEKYSPLYIQKEDGNLSKTNTFLVPRWGAIKIQNFPKRQPGKESLVRAETIDSQGMMGVFLAQLRALLGIERPKELDDVDLVLIDVGNTAIRDWEFDYLVRARVVENIATSIHTLNSLAQLLDKIRNIVINDHIAEHVYSAVDAVRKAKHSLKTGDLTNALNFSNAAFRSSEIAFFDPTLLELLYFPEDQKFAIYIPLFLPIALPLLGSFFSALKWLKGCKTEKLKEE